MPESQLKDNTLQIAYSGNHLTRQVNDSVAIQARRRHVKAKEYGIVDGCDLRNVTVQEEFVSYILQKKSREVHMANPCASITVAALFEGSNRTSEHSHGKPGISPENSARLQEGDKHLAFVLTVWDACVETKTSVTWELPGPRSREALLGWAHRTITKMEPRKRKGGRMYCCRQAGRAWRRGRRQPRRGVPNLVGHIQRPYGGSTRAAFMPTQRPEPSSGK